VLDSRIFKTLVASNNRDSYGSFLGIGVFGNVRFLADVNSNGLESPRFRTKADAINIKKLLRLLWRRMKPGERFRN